MSELFINHLQVQFNGCSQAALSIPKLMVAAGSHVAVTGASGSGKTTLVNTITGLSRCEIGQVFWDAEDIGRLSESQRDRWRAENIGLVMQDFHLYPGLSALENVLLPSRFYHWRIPVALKKKAVELLERVGIQHSHKRLVDRLSRGEKQRVAITRALLPSPPIVIADEPTASLDADNGAQVIQLLAQFAQESKSTLICITHDNRLAEKMRRRITLDNGRPVKDIVVGKTI